MRATAASRSSATSPASVKPGATQPATTTRAATKPATNPDAPSSATPLRVLRVPVTEPYALGATRVQDVVAPTQGTLALALPGSAAGAWGLPAESDDEAEVDTGFGPLSTSTTDLPDPVATATRLVQGVLEVLGGSRPPQQMARWLSADVYAGLQRRAALVARIQRRSSAGSRHGVVRRVRASSPVDGVVEASAVVVDGERVRAVALRLEGLDGRWRATALEIG